MALINRLIKITQSLIFTLIEEYNPLIKNLFVN